MPGDPVLLGRFDVGEDLQEVSGIAVSGIDPDRLWLLDDGPGTTAVVAVSRDGSRLGRVTMAGVEGRDTEAIAVGPCSAEDPTPCIYVGDIGDNTGSREAVQVHRFPEPATLDGTPVPVQTATFTLPDGPVDAEAMVVGTDALPVLLTKEVGRTRVMAATVFADGVLQQVADIAIQPPASPVLTLFVDLAVTDAALSGDGTALLLRTYDHVLLLRDPQGTGLAGLAGWSTTEVPSTLEPQGEAVTWLPGPDGTAGAPPAGFVTASEGIGDLWFTALPVP